MNKIRIFAIMSENKNIEENEKSADEGRREALKKLGTYAFAAPVMMSLVASKKATAASFTPPTPPTNGPRG